MWMGRASEAKQPQSPLAKCYLGDFTSNMHLSDSDRVESRYTIK